MRKSGNFSKNWINSTNITHIISKKKKIQIKTYHKQYNKPVTPTNSMQILRKEQILMLSI